jgi:murein L,D-transpeptidase YcbB/YkuD
VARAQLRYGLPPTGAADAQTIAALNVPADARAAQIRANLERLRWLPAVDPPTRVDVNTAAATFDYVEDGRPALHMLAAAGRPGDETPILASAVDAVVLNPPWNVPDGIAQDELYPKEQSQPGYFAAHGFKVTDAGGAPRLVQEPGPDSALGLVKFEFRNPYAVYMHDTPAKAAFARTDRAVSHGCVRLQAAVDFAKRLLSRESGWPAERVDEVIASRETTHIPLKHKVPVRLVYLTAFPEGVGVSFRDDIYGWDPLLLSVLDANAGRLPAQGARVATR